MTSATESFLETHFAAQPEDASALGVRASSARLGDPSATAAELAAYRAALRELEAEEDAAAGASSAPAPGEADAQAAGARLDRDAALRAARFHVRYLENDGHAGNLELALLPNAALQHALLHAKIGEDWDALAMRAAAVPSFLERQRENLRRGVRDGRAPDREVALALATRVFPGAAEATRTLAANARARGAGESHAARIDDGARAGAEAYASFAAFVRDAVVPALRAREDAALLGEDEVAFRLRDTMGLVRDAAELLAFARGELERARAELRELASANGHASVGEAIRAVVAPHPPSVEDAVSLYARNVAAATRFVAERRLVALPERLDFAFEPLPKGVADGTSITNWPAPLLDPEGRGHCLYGDDVSAHVTVATKNLAVHEAIPGHYLQSATWQRAFARGERKRASIARFLGVADDVAAARGAFGTMLSVEGWAVYMERLLRAEGFYEAGAETLFFAFCDALRAFRVVVDLELHTRASSAEALVLLGAEATSMPVRWAEAQILRTKRIPLQSMTYLVGAAEIDDLRATLAPPSLEVFHRALLGLGPVPISRARAALVGAAGAVQGARAAGGGGGGGGGATR